MDRVAVILSQYDVLKNQRSRLNSLWEEIAEVLSPDRVGFSGGRRGDVAPSKIFDTAPLVAKRGLVNALGGMLRPKSSSAGKWFSIVPEDEELMDSREVKVWVNRAEERMWRSMYNPRARFIEATGECDDDIVTFGTAVGFCGLRNDGNGLLFRSFNLASTYLEVDAENRVTGVYVREHLTPRQAANKWGADNLGRLTKEKLERTTRGNATDDEKCEFVWLVTPRHDRDPRIKNSKNMPFCSVVVDVASEHIVLEEGYEEMPFFTPRWDTRSGEVYGRGPGVMALPDVLTLNSMGKTMLRALHRAVDPTWLLPSDSMVDTSKLIPGGVSYYDAKAIRNLGLANPFVQMGSTAQVPWGLNAQQSSREQVFALFYRNVLNLPVDAPQMTATEVIQRREEFVREIGAVFGRLETDYSGPMVERAFNIMLRKGAFGPIEDIPDALQGASVTFRFASPVERAKKQIDEATVLQGVAKVLEIGQIQPSVMDRYNWDEVAKFIADSNDMPPQLTLDDKAVQAIAAQRQQQAAQAAKMDAMERGAKIAKDVGGMVGNPGAGLPGLGGAA